MGEDVDAAEGNVEQTEGEVRLPAFVEDGLQDLLPWEKMGCR